MGAAADCDRRGKDEKGVAHLRRTSPPTFWCRPNTEISCEGRHRGERTSSASSRCWTACRFKKPRLNKVSRWCVGWIVELYSEGLTNGGEALGGITTLLFVMRVGHVSSH